MAPVHRAVDLEHRPVGAEVDRVPVDQRGSQRVARRRLGGPRRDERAERHDHEDEHGASDPALVHRRSAVAGQHGIRATWSEGGVAVGVDERGRGAEGHHAIRSAASPRS